MWDAINNYHGLGDGFIKDVHTTHKNYDFGVFIMFYDVLLLVSNGGDLGMVYHCFAMCSFRINDMRVQGYWRFHQGPQSLIFQYWTGWRWFGTGFIFPYIGNDNPNWLIFFREVDTNQERLNFLASELEPQSRALWGTQLDSDDFCRPVGSNEKNLVSGMTPIYHN